VGAVRAQQLSDVEVEVAAEWLNTYKMEKFDQRDVYANHVRI
jgi:hypothetical protein